MILLVDEGRGDRGCEVLCCWGVRVGGSEGRDGPFYTPRISSKSPCIWDSSGRKFIREKR